MYLLHGNLNTTKIRRPQKKTLLSPTYWGQNGKTTANKSPRFTFLYQILVKIGPIS